MDESDRMCADLDLCNSERDALRAEVERYKRALEKAIGLGHYCPPGYTDCDDAGSDIKDCAQCRSEWALTEAGKGDEG